MSIRPGLSLVRGFTYSTLAHHIHIIQTRPELKRFLHKWQDKADGKLELFNGIVIYTLQKQLNRL